MMLQLSTNPHVRFDSSSLSEADLVTKATGLSPATLSCPEPEKEDSGDWHVGQVWDLSRTRGKASMR